MSLLTPFLKLFKWDTTNEIDLESEFNIDKSMNENWDKLDTKAQEHENKILDIENNIENIQTKDTEQDKLIQKLQSNMINESTEEATSLYVEDASDLPAKLNIEGNYYQETQEGTDNLAVLSEGSITQDGITIDIENGIATSSGINTSDTTTYINIGQAYLYEGQTYYMYAERNQSSGYSGIRIKNENVLKYFTSGEEVVFECTKTGIYNIEISYTVSTVAVSATFKLLISKISGAEWVQGKKAIPSIEYPSEIKIVKDNIKIIQCNKNFFNVNSSNRGGVDLVFQEDGKYLINGTSTTSWTFREGEEILLKAGDYTLSVETEKETFNGFFGIRGSNNFKYETKKEIHISLTEDKIVRCYFTCSATATFDNVVVKVQLEKSDVKTDWIEHEEKTYNLAVQQEMLNGDYFDLENEKEIHTWKKYIVTNVDDWTFAKLNTRFDVKKIVTPSANTSTIAICNMFKQVNVYSKTGCFFENDSTFHISIIFGDYGFTSDMTVDDVKNRLNEIFSKTPLVFYYTTTATELDLTTAQKETLAQLNALELFKGVNNICTEQDLALLQLNYTVDTKMYIDNKIANTNAQVLNM